jgi:chorismate lyase/3-hydroxybenzoate synthase
MEKTQANAKRAARRIDRDLVDVAVRAAPFALDYLTAVEFARHQARFGDRLLGAIAFGAATPAVAVPACPYAWVNMPVLTRDTMFEVWTSDRPVLREDEEGMMAAHNEDLLFGCLRVEADAMLEQASFTAYSRIFDSIDRRGYGHLLRAWNYVPQINADDHGLERYARFNMGRHDAFMAKKRIIGAHTPAASALGCQGNHLTIYFLAAKQAGHVIENPRQMSAFRYPAQYGPRSPTFARAMLMQAPGEGQLFVSGTSSIVGHLTMHAGDANAQARETVANLLTVIAEARQAGFDASSPQARLLLKAYLRRPEDLAMMQACLMQAFGEMTRVAYLQANICRADLLVEVEAAYLSQPVL